MRHVAKSILTTAAAIFLAIVIARGLGVAARNATLHSDHRVNDADLSLQNEDTCVLLGNKSGRAFDTNQGDNHKKSKRQQALTEQKQKRKLHMISITKAECVRCGEELSAPACSGYVSAEELHNFWSCSNCGYMFETMDLMAAGTSLSTELKKCLPNRFARDDSGVADENRPDCSSY